MTTRRQVLGRIRYNVARLVHERWRRIRPTTGGIRWGVIEAKRVELARRRTFGSADLDRLADVASLVGGAVPIRDAIRLRDRPASAVLAMRHDMDHDVENSVRFAEWEAAHRIRSTYYVLHTDWYWGDRPDSPSAYLVRALRRIASLGHEIGVHNNAITAALRTGEDPVAILDAVLSGLRRRGFDISGTVAHGDPLCRVARYFNHELFIEHPYSAYGPPDRTIAHDAGSPRMDGRVRLRPVPMAQLGLAYEANFIGHDLYLSDTGGHWNQPFEDVEARFASEGGLLQVLVHPVWWAFGGELVRPRPASASATTTCRR